MPLTQLTLTNNVSWAMQVANLPFQPTSQGVDSLAFNLGNLSITTWCQADIVQFSLASGASQTIDLTSFVNLVNEAVSLEHFLLLFCVGNANVWTIAPGTSNGLQLFGSTSPLTVPAGGNVSYSYNPGGTGLVIDSTHKTLKFTNTGGTTDTLSVIIAGSIT